MKYMFSWKFSFEYSESPTDSNLMSIFIGVKFEEVKMKDILDIDGFFNSILKEGYQSFFTCSCGNFGCGGYYVKVIHGEHGIRLVNSYKPNDYPSEKDKIDSFVFNISWEDLYLMASSLLEYMNDIRCKNPGFDLCSGVFGPKLACRLDEYETILQSLRNKYEV